VFENADNRFVKILSLVLRKYKKEEEKDTKWVNEEKKKLSYKMVDCPFEDLVVGRVTLKDKEQEILATYIKGQPVFYLLRMKEEDESVLELIIVHLS